MHEILENNESMKKGNRRENVGGGQSLVWYECERTSK